MAKAQPKREDDLSEKPSVRKKLLKIFGKISRAYADQRPRANDSLDFWDMYNCILGMRQVYNGNSQIFLPFVRDSVEARVTRFTNQLFPQSDRHVEAITTETDLPHATLALTEHYIDEANLRTEVVPALLRAGDVEGHYHCYVGWRSSERFVTYRKSHPLTAGGLEFPDLGEIETVADEEVVDAGPYVEVLSDTDVVVWPATADNIADAMKKGGGVCVIRRWSEAEIDDMAKDGEISEAAAEAVKKGMDKTADGGKVDNAKNLADAAGIKIAGDRKYLLAYEAWLKIKIGGKLRMVRARFGGDELILSCHVNPFWCDLCPVVSRPLQKVPGVFKGMSKVGPGVRDMQVLANDIVNEMADLGHFTVFPVVMTDPTKNPNYASMKMDLMAVWETSPRDTQPLTMPDTAAANLQKLASLKQEIFQALSVSPAMMPQQTGAAKGGKRSQAEVALEQQVDLLTTADAAEIVEGLLTQVVQRFVEYDLQYRETPLLVRAFGELGLRAIMEEIPPLQRNRRWKIVWNGVQQAKNAQQIQQQIGAVNVVRGIPKEMYPGYTLDVTPVMTHLIENVFGPRIAPLMFKPANRQLSVDPEIENQLLQQGFPVAVNLSDDDAKHIKVHAQLAQNDPSGNARVHIQAHQRQMQMKAAGQAMQAMMQQRGQQGAPPAGGQRGISGTRPGSQPGPQKLIRGPNGAIHPDQMARAGAPAMPRRM